MSCGVPTLFTFLHPEKKRYSPALAVALAVAWKGRSLSRPVGNAVLKLVSPAHRSGIWGSNPQRTEAQQLSPAAPIHCERFRTEWVCSSSPTKEKKTTLRSMSSIVFARKGVIEFESYSPALHIHRIELGACPWHVCVGVFVCWFLYVWLCICTYVAEIKFPGRPWKTLPEGSALARAGTLKIEWGQKKCLRICLPHGQLPKDTRKLRMKHEWMKYGWCSKHGGHFTFSFRYDLTNKLT